jgi:hypothetical protein
MEAALDMLDKVYELPETQIIAPNFEQIMFYIAGNPFEGQNIVYQFLSKDIVNGKDYYRDERTGILFPVDGTAVDVKTDDIKNNGMFIDYTPDVCHPWRFSSTRVYALLQMENDVVVTRGTSDYMAKGKMRVIGIKQK